MTGRLSSLSPSPHFTTLGTLPASNLEIPPLPGAAEPDGSCSLPGSSIIFARDNGKEKGRGLPAKMAVEGEGRRRPGICSPGAKATPCGNTCWGP